MPTTLTAYSFDELSPEAQERALSDLPDDDCAFTVDECAQSLKAFAAKVSRTCGVTLENWSIGAYSRHTFTKFDMSDEVKALDGPRSLAWIENNIFAVIRQSWRSATVPLNDKWASIHGKYSRRYYKPDEVIACPYTGVCFDEDILEAFRDRDLNQTIGDRFASIGGRLSRVIESDLEYANSAAGKRERADFDDVLFDKKGKRIA